METTEKDLPTFTEYITEIKEYYTNRDTSIYFRLSMVSPSRFRIKEAYYVKVDYDTKEKYLKKFSKVIRLSFRISDLKIKLPKNCLIEFDTKEMEANVINKLPYEVFE